MLGLLSQAGHDVVTVSQEELSGAADELVLRQSSKEQRRRVTLDLGFGNILDYKPSDYSGIAVFRLPRNPSHDDLISSANILLKAMEKTSITGKLWIVQKNSLREYQEETPDPF